MELSLSHTLHLFNIFRECDGKDNCAQVLEEEIYKMFGTKYLNDEHNCNVFSMNSLNIHDTNDDCTSESTDPRPRFEVLQYRFCSLLLLCTLLFLFYYYKNQYVLSLLHLYHHLFVELVHLYNLPLYLVCWGHKRLFVVLVAGLFERDHLHPMPPID